MAMALFKLNETHVASSVFDSFLYINKLFNHPGL